MLEALRRQSEAEHFPLPVRRPATPLPSPSCCAPSSSPSLARHQHHCHGPPPPPHSTSSLGEERPAGDSSSGEERVKLPKKRRIESRDDRSSSREVRSDAASTPRIKRPDARDGKDNAAAGPPPDACLFHRVEALDQMPRLHLSLIIKVARSDPVLGFICSAWPDDLTVRHFLTLRGAGSTGEGDHGGRDLTKLEPREREAVKKFLQEREVDADLAEFLHNYVANKEKMELLQWLKIAKSFVEK